VSPIRVAEGRVVIHLLNLAYEEERDDVRTLPEVELQVDLEALGVFGCDGARILSPDRASTEVPIQDGRLLLPDLGLWTLLVFEQAG
jgi:hypothetical protein